MAARSLSAAALSIAVAQNLESSPCSEAVVAQSMDYDPSVGSW